MFGSGRIVVIDDEEAYLTQLAGTLHRMGVPCIPIHYTGGIPEDAGWLSGCRIAFCDLHLMPAAANIKSNYAAIGSLLDRMATKESSLLLVLWTRYPEDAAGLEEYLAERHPDSVPATILPLDKKDFGGDRGADLPNAVRDKLQGIPQLRALYEWQDDVSTAAAACVGSLVGLARGMDGDMNGSLDKVLSALAQKATGVEIAAAHPGAALQDILSALLADRLSHLPEDAQHDELWKKAMPSAMASTKCGAAVVGGVAAINTALHIAHPHGEHMSGRDRGAVIAVPCPSLFRHRFASNEKAVREKFAIKHDTPVRWVGIQIEASCDHAQRKSLSIPYILGAEVASDTKPTNSSPAVWKSPVFLSEKKEAVKIFANVGLTTSISWKRAEGRSVLYRFRDPLVSALTVIKAQHEMRPGIISLDGRD
ncbi:hypothetical protein J5837_04100 [Pseudoxanthomonas helianthi]|uniref:Uncharacterized protein n=1 Tax=Pseudoxanthomonas helianthi TaxID=1453541 RepID=A0A940WZU1_9GAMM|nr:hypothetical protein [Pseudoxanthomonas helianthi]MBP3983600.1 hypothetical protein [Pseudoxanthomonas helianthi]